MLPDASKFVVDFVETVTEVRIDGLLSDACTLDTCSVMKTIRLSVGPKSTQEGVRLLLDFFRLDSLRRNYGETMRHWTRRFTLQYS